MSDKSNQVLEEIHKKIKWLLRTRAEKYLDLRYTKKVKQLHRMGFKTQEIAEFVGSSEESVRGMKPKIRDEEKIKNERQ